MQSPVHRAKSASMSSRKATRSGIQSDEFQPSNPTLLDYTQTHPTTDVQHDFLTRPALDSPNGTRSRKATPVLGHSRSGSSFQALNVSDNRISAGPSVVMSSMSSMPSLTQAQPQKKPSGLKATIRRMFGSKRRRTVVDEGRQEFLRSDPGNLMITSQSQHIRGPSSGSSRPHTATKGGALTSHAIASSFDGRDFGASNPEESSYAFRRRNTLPSLAFSDHEAQSFAQRIGHMHDEIEQTIRNERTTSISDKRRSKSADELAARYNADAQDAVIRQDRDSEIAFWRNSMLLNSLPKSNNQETRETIPADTVERVKEVSSLEQIIRPAQSFDFGLDNVEDEPADLDERLNTLEVKMFDFEYAIAKLQGVEIPKPRLPTRKVRRKNVQEVFTKPSMRSLSTATSGIDRAPITPEDSPLLSDSFKDSARPDRGSKATTIRPLIRVDSPARSSFRMTVEQYDNLMNMLQDEKDARQLMEMQILDMQKEIASLQTPVYATINYPTSDPNNGVSAQKKLHRSPPFRFHRPLPRETSRFSTTESDSDSFNDGYEETFQTPREQQHKFASARSSPLVGMV